MPYHALRKKLVCMESGIFSRSCTHHNSLLVFNFVVEMSDVHKERTGQWTALRAFPSCYDSKSTADHVSPLPLWPHPILFRIIFEANYFISSLSIMVCNSEMCSLLENITILQSDSTVPTIRFYCHQICCWHSQFPGCSREDF